jgi:hypothetical protein
MGIHRFLARFSFILLAGLPAAYAQQYTYDEQSAYAADSGYSAAELDQMLAPVALYPDELLSQVLMAATYPLEVVQAARWSRANPGLQGDEAVQAVDGEDWDPSVKSLVAFPNILESMDQNLEWTQRLGEAFLADQDAVMASVQRLRRAAMDQGYLSSTDEMVVTRDGADIAIDPPSPEMVYVPYYDPRVVYGNWWWPANPPVYWAPWSGYRVGSYGFGWSLGVPVGVNFFFGDFDWRRHRVHVDRRPFYFHDRNHRPITVRNGEWRWDPHHRRDVPFRNPVARQEYGNARAPREVRRPQQQQAARPAAPVRRGDGAASPRTPAPAPAPAQSASPLARPSQQQGFFPQQQQPQREARPAQAPRARAAQPGAQPAPQAGVQTAPKAPAAQAPAARPPSGGVDRYFSRQQFGHPQAQPAPKPQEPQAQPLARPAPQARQPQAQPLARPAPQGAVPRPAPQAPAPRAAPQAPHPAPQAAARPAPQAPHPAPAARGEPQHGGNGHPASNENGREGPRER